MEVLFYLDADYDPRVTAQLGKVVAETDDTYTIQYTSLMIPYTATVPKEQVRPARLRSYEQVMQSYTNPFLYSPKAFIWLGIAIVGYSYIKS